MEVWPVQHAKARFSELLDACQREGPQVVSRRGIETAVLVPIEEWRRVQARSRPSLKALLLTAEPRIEALAPERGRGRQVQVKVGARAAPACFHQPSARAFHPKPQQHSAGTWPRPIRSLPGGLRRTAKPIEPALSSLSGARALPSLLSSPLPAHGPGDLRAARDRPSPAPPRHHVAMAPTIARWRHGCG